MSDDGMFRLLVMITVGLFAPFAIYRRLRSFTDERLDRWQEGAFILFGLRLSALAFFLSLMAWMIDPGWMQWSALPLPLWLRSLGLLLLASSGILTLWTFHNLGKNLTDTVVTRREHSLVTSGPYRFVRHPFYIAFALGASGISLMSANWFIPLLGMLPFAFLCARTRIEERKLVERFGTAYEEYMRRVPRFLP